MTSFDYDLFVIGGGSGGVRAARIAAQHGARVAIAEEFRYGGTCVIRGCVPKKLFVYAAEIGHELADAGAYGWRTGPVAFDWATLIANKDAEIDRLNRIYIDLLDRAKVQVLHGRAVLVDDHTVAVRSPDGHERRASAAVILVATGSRPRWPDIPGGEHVISSNEVFHLERFPNTITLAGGGYISVEFAHVFAGLGARVVLVHRGSKVLSGFDDDVRTEVTEGLRQRGVELHLDTVITAVEPRPEGGFRAHLADGGEIDSDVVMCAIGRVPNTDDMGLEQAGVTLREGGAVHVNEWSRTSADNIYAVGDCTDRITLTPVAIREGHAFADAVFGHRAISVDYANVPTAVFSQPPVGVVGLTETEARAQGAVDVYSSRFRPLKHTLSGRDEYTMIKLVVDQASQRVLGVHMVGLDAPEIIQCMAVAVHMGVTKDDLDATVAVHPTTAEELVLMRAKRR